MESLFRLFLACVLVLASCNKDNAPIAVGSVSLSQTTLTLNVKQTATLTATVLPDNAPEKSVMWSSSKPAVATVGNNGLVTAVSLGTTTITATAGGKSATCTVTVEPIPVGSITLDKTQLSLKHGESETLTATVQPDDATDKSVAWSSDEPDIATVDQNGMVTALSPGLATITATAGEKSATCAVTVEPGVLINGVVWATTNVDAPGTFAANPEDAGMFYQWNLKIGWSATDPMTSSPAGQKWQENDPPGDSWDADNDPCPEGWRLPIYEELDKLVDAGKVSSEWTTRNGVNGREFKDNSSGNTVFVPAVGFRPYGSLKGEGVLGEYWTSDLYFNGHGMILLFNNTAAGILYNPRSSGCPIRCVQK